MDDRNEDRASRYDQSIAGDLAKALEDFEASIMAIERKYQDQNVLDLMHAVIRYRARDRSTTEGVGKIYLAIRKVAERLLGRL